MATDSPGRVGDTRHDGPHQARQKRASGALPRRCRTTVSWSSGG